MRRSKLILAVGAAVVTMMVLAAPAMAQTVFGSTGGEIGISGDSFGDGVSFGGGVSFGDGEFDIRGTSGGIQGVSGCCFNTADFDGGISVG